MKANRGRVECRQYLAIKDINNMVCIYVYSDFKSTFTFAFKVAEVRMPCDRPAGLVS
jgi:hypothetical protein